MVILLVYLLLYQVLSVVVSVCCMTVYLKDATGHLFLFNPINKN